jgi:hypothetical protein
MTMYVAPNSGTSDDHRIVDGAEALLGAGSASSCTSKPPNMIANPERMLLGL